jgi:uncharacterized membrane protein (DUF373 family)
VVHLVRELVVHLGGLDRIQMLVCLDIIQVLVGLDGIRVLVWFSKEKVEFNLVNRC